MTAARALIAGVAKLSRQHTASKKASKSNEQAQFHDLACGHEARTACKRVPAGKDVAIAGAGLGGLAFGLSLLKLCKDKRIKPLPRIHMFERDSSATARAGMGYALGIRSDSGGLQVLQRLGVAEDLLPFQEVGAPVAFADAKFRPLASIATEPLPDFPVNRLRISRSSLRQVMLDHYQRQAGITFGKMCTGAKLPAAPGEQLTLSFQDGTEHRTDLLVAADGANSKLRSALLPQEKLQHLGLVTLYGVTRKLEKLPPALQQGQWLAIAPTASTLFLSTLNRDCVIWGMSWKAPQQLAGQLNAQLQEAGAAREAAWKLAEQQGAAFGEPWPTIWAATDRQKLQAAPVVQKPPHTNIAPVVFIGDSCHAMPAFAGNGANMAFRDAWQLAEELTNPRHKALDEVVSAYDAKSGPRNAKQIRQGESNISSWFRQGWGYYRTVAFWSGLGVLVRLLKLGSMPFKWIARLRRKR